MSALLVAVLLAAEPLPSDTPTAVHVDAGVAAPFSGVLLTDVQAVAKAKELVACTAERDELRKGATPSWVPIVVAAAVGAVAGGATVAVIAAARR